MSRVEVALNLLAQQRNDALDAFVNSQADNAMLRAELDAANKRIAELEAQLPQPTPEGAPDVGNAT